MTAALAIEPGVRAIPAERWRAHLVSLAGVVAAILLLFRADAAHMFSIWWNSSTFSHCLLIPPILAWLVAQRLPELRQLVPSAWAPGLLVVAAGASAWLVGDAAGVALARHAGLVVMLQGAVVACLGKTVARGLAFPLLYALFLIPAGEELVPAMQTLTAEMATGLLGLAGVPAHLDGVFITAPAGWFEVAEACAGVKFLVAMAALGVLAAYLCFRSWKRRLLFVAAALALPILANGVRAFATIWVAHRTSVEAATGFDHILYGWLFFALVIAILFAAAWPFFDRGPDEPAFDPSALQPARPAPEPVARPAAIAAAALLIAAVPPAWSAAVAGAGARPVSASFALPAVPGWEAVPPDRSWRPSYPGADLYRFARYRDSGGRTVDLALAVYARQEEGRELVGFGRGAAGPGWAWTADAPPPPGGRAERIASHGLVREVAIFYRVGRITTGSDAGVKLETMRTRLLGGSSRAVAVLVSAPEPGARAAIDAFLAALGPVDRLADSAAGLE